MFTLYGCDTNRWFPQKSHGPLAASDITNSLAPLAPYTSKLLIPRGIRAMNEWTMKNQGSGLGLGQGNDPHLNACGTYFTLQPVTPNSDNPADFSPDTKINARPVGTSLDHVMAQQVSPGGLPLFMRVGNSGGTHGEGPQSNISYLKTSSDAFAPADVYPGLGTPLQVFSMLTGLFAPGAASPDSYAAARGKMVSDLVKDDLESLKRTGMSRDDRNKLTAWEDLLNTVGSAVSAPVQCTPDLANRLGVNQDTVTAAGMAPASGDVLTNMVTNSLDGADMYSVMAVLSVMCNFNPINVLKYPPTYTFTGLGIPLEAAALSRRLANSNLTGTCYPNALTYIRTIDTYYATKFATLIGLLNSVANPDGSTLLDSSAAVWFQEMSDGLAGNLNNLPIVQAGGCGGYFKTGWTVNVEDGSATLTQGNSEVDCADGTANGMANGTTQETGTPSSVANAPINKYFYNLMNAIGVKGDATTGLPAKGGTGPVTQFGYSDLTTDFCGGLGGTTGATIHSPGEYTALKSNG